MSYTPIDFENDTAPYLEADNMNHIQQGVVLAVDRSRLVDEAWKNGDLKGDKGDRGLQGEKGLQGIQGIQGIKGDTGSKGDKGDRGDTGAKGDKGDDGRDFHIDGHADTYADLPPAKDHINQWWLVNDTKILYHSHGDVWNEAGEVGGVKGDKGDKGDQGERGLRGDKGDKGDKGEQGSQGIQGIQGEKGEDGVIDIDSLTEAQLKKLHEKLYKFNDVYRWHYKTSIVSGKVSRVPVGDLNLYLEFTNYGAAMMTYKVVPMDAQKPSSYYIKRLTSFDLVGWEGMASTGYVSRPVPQSGFVLDGAAFYAGRERIVVDIYDSSNGSWHLVDVFGDGTPSVLLIDVTKRAAQGRMHVSPV